MTELVERYPLDPRSPQAAILGRLITAERMSASNNPTAPGDVNADVDVARAFDAGHAQTTRTVGTWIDRVVRQRSWRFQDPDNVVQEVTLRLLQLVRAGKFRGGSTFRTFVHSVATHVCIDVYRREKRLSARESAGDDVERTPGAGNPESELAERERSRMLAYVYQRISEECRGLWRQVYFERRRAAEIASELGISENATRVRVHRCLQRARAIVHEMQSGIPPAGKGAMS